MNRKVLEELNQQLTRILPRAGALGDDVRGQISAAVQKALARMDLPTREEFDQQRQALEQAQARITELEAVVARLEAGERDSGDPT
ncbi:MAG: accessory factor UbiK family protein [Pseudohongiellaceae bacterium]